MPWIKEELHHETFMDEFWQLILRRFDTGGRKWWPDMNSAVEKIDIYKICFTEGLLEYDENGDFVPPKQKEKGSFCITHHSIMRRHDGEFLGLAQSTGAIEAESTMFEKDPQELLNQFKVIFKNSVDFTKLYAYMLEDYTHFTHFEGEDGAEAVTIITEDHGFGVFNSSMDVEFHTDAHYERGMYQSPYAMINFVGGEINKIGTVGKLNFATDTNWWADSKVVVQGWVDHKSMTLVMQADAVPYWEENKTPQIPFFHGNLMRDEEYQEQVALFSGTAIDNPHFNFDDPTLSEEVVQPVTRNYVYHPSNGVDSIMLKRSKQGGRYQAHSLSWNAPPNQMPPVRSHLEADVIKEEQVELLVDRMTFQDKTTIPISEGTELIEFEPFGLTDDTDVLAKHSHILIGRNEIAELVEYNEEEWWMKVRRIARAPKTFPIGTELIGITPETVDIFYKKYPRAWNQLESTIMSYQFNPSRYSEKVQSSYAYVVHPEAGKVGYLPNVVVAPAISVTNNTILEVNVHCEECEEEAYTPEVPEMGEMPVWNPVINSTLLNIDEVTEGALDSGASIPEGKLPNVEVDESTTGGSTGGTTDKPKDKTFPTGDLIDTDKDGKVEGVDFNGDGVIDVGDTNGDGKVDTDDIPRDAAGKVDAPKEWDYVDDAAPGWDIDDDGKVDLPDKDKDGKLSEEELDEGIQNKEKDPENAEKFDTDGDGKVDAWDLNGDGKPDAWDTDDDGKPDAKDTDKDGKPDSYDTDNDGKADKFDFNGDDKPDAWDTDLDGKPDVFDQDGDGKVDAWDTNNDGSGKPDAYDTDGDGKPDTFDTDGDGEPDSYDTDGDGKIDSTSPNGAAYGNPSGLHPLSDSVGGGVGGGGTYVGGLGGSAVAGGTSADGSPYFGYDGTGDGNVDWWEGNFGTGDDSDSDDWEKDKRKYTSSDNDSGFSDMWDYDGDGWIDAWDNDYDGIIDAWDIDGDGEPDMWSTDGTGIPNLWADEFGGTTDVRPDWAPLNTPLWSNPTAWDVNGDGKPDVWDRSGNGRPDAWATVPSGRPNKWDNNGDGRVDAVDTSYTGTPTKSDLPSYGRPYY